MFGKLKIAKMELQNNLENKAKFFTQYWGQEVFNNGATGIYEGWLFTGSDHDEIDHNDFLYLKPLSLITDEDAYYVGASVNCWSWAERKEDWFKDSDDLKENHIDYGKMFSSSIGKEYGPGLSHPFAHNSTDILHGFDYLRSKGYALPYMGLSVETMVDYGWIKLIC